MTTPLPTELPRCDEALAATATKVLEELAFFFVEPDPDAANHTPGVDYDGIVCVVDFVGPYDGRLEFHLPAPLASALAANMLGDDAAPPNLVRDAAGEVANVICGNVLPTLAGSDVSFSLEVEGAAFVPHENGTPEIAIASLLAEGEKILVRLCAMPHVEKPAEG